VACADGTNAKASDPLCGTKGNECRCLSELRVEDDGADFSGRREATTSCNDSDAASTFDSDARTDKRGADVGTMSMSLRSGLAG
jgi:hypothetical protein